MASEPNESVSALIHRLIATPLFSAFATARSVPDSISSSENPNSESTNASLDRIIVVNPFTQHMMVIGGSGTDFDFDSVLNDLMKKEGQPPASEASIDGMPVIEVKSENEIERFGGECVICLEEWKVGDVAKEMPCQHRFHGGCVEKWLRIHGSCPVCRYKMPVHDLGKKIGDESGRRRRREIWVTFAVGDRRLISEEEEEEEESSSES